MQKVYVVVLLDSHTDPVVRVFARKVDAERYAAKEWGQWDQGVEVREETIN